MEFPVLTMEYRLVGLLLLLTDISCLNLTWVGIFCCYGCWFLGLEYKALKSFVTWLLRISVLTDTLLGTFPLFRMPLFSFFLPFDGFMT